ncbi:aminotransferase class I/II-fold pyridoxal phosphate-dependent enzyme [Suipraeoptans intestinalis]|uniref:aminotransferase class I/II-fold pyridoxal phosphate-dependent enzyme n=1 Tax=Suipraeoptans intestinalis TaxID=2606628 RepID=UPI0023F4B8E7|nr:aminotransferase class I/II-fold pyridoxal phosphate-dependent enzyme [Suipraeoptans intestinalis]MDD7770635.1 aminotransferase class I/II-fold pyridoxal phosphate-dependent enzyme [Suipraeoptans intestinalis]
MKTLFERLQEYGESDYYGFHMPGHKRNPVIPGMESMFRIDITEIEGFDDLHHPEGILRESQERAAKLFGAEETCFLVNGSTAGILASLLGAFQEGDKVLVARNCHKSVYNGIYLGKLRPVYLYPEVDPDTGLNKGIREAEVRRALEVNPKIRGIVLVSPTYDGVVSEIDRIALAARERGIPLIVDEAHGAHFGFHPYFPASANEKGADIVIHSLHKTLPALTQTALLHFNGDRVDRERVKGYLSMLQTSSPSYLFLTSIGQCIDLLEREKEELFCSYVDRLKRFRESFRAYRSVKLLETGCYDPSKVVIRVEGWTGKQVSDRLRKKHHLEMEMAAGTYVLAMTSVADNDTGFARLEAALKELEKEGPKKAEAKEAKALEALLSGGGRSSIREYDSFEVETQRKARGARRIRIEESGGRVSLEYAYLYPPGVPLLVPGEKITKESIAVLQYYKELGYAIHGLREEERIEVLGNGKDILCDGKEFIG